jgi:phage replication O-like protein O
MLDVQTGKGFTKIDNELFEAILRSDFSLRELKVIFTVIRFTCGFQRDEAELSLRFIAKTTGIKYQHVGGTIEDLKLKNVLFSALNCNHKQGRNITLNNDYSTWNSDSARKGYSNQRSYGLVPEKVTVTVTKTVTKKDIYKENINKVFTHWNSKNIIKHKQLNDGIERKINSALKSFTVEEIITAIDNYYLILNGDDYFFKYKWTLSDFLQRGLEKFMDKGTAESNYKKRDAVNKQNIFELNPLFNFKFRGHNDEQD